MTLAVTPESWDSADATALREAQQRELRARYDGDAEPGVTTAAGDIDAFFVGRDAAGTAIACGGLRRLETGVRQPEAIAFYTCAGYRLIPNFGPYAGEATSLCFERSLG